MKINLNRVAIATLTFLCFLCATSAFAQTAPVVSNNPTPIQMQEHLQHATDHALASESSLFRATSPYSYAQGEVPLAELGTIPYETPLGDVARAYRKEHAVVPKATKVLQSE
jgi:hypothetical protein